MRGARLTSYNVVLKVSHEQKSFRDKGLALTVRADPRAPWLSGRLIPSLHASARKAKARTQIVTMRLKAHKTTAVKLQFTKRGLDYLQRRSRTFVDAQP